MQSSIPRTLRMNTDQLRQIANLVTANTQWLAIAAGTVAGTNSNFDQRVATDPPIIPAGYAFAIWGFIYPAALAYSVYQALPAQRENPLLREVGWYTASAYLAMTCWAVAAQQQTELTVVCMLWILISLTGAFIALLRFRDMLSPNDRRFVLVPVSTHLGWITVATVANIAIWLQEAGYRDLALSPQNWAAVMAGAAGVIAAGVTQVSRGNVWYAGTVIWGLVGVAVANVTLNKYPVVAIAAGGATAMVGAALVRARGNLAINV